MTSVGSRLLGSVSEVLGEIAALLIDCGIPEARHTWPSCLSKSLDCICCTRAVSELYPNRARHQHDAVSI